MLGGFPAEIGLRRAQLIADAVVSDIRQLADQLAPGFGVAASAGVTGWTAGRGESPAAGALLRQVDETMYVAKRSGKGRSALAAVA